MPIVSLILTSTIIILHIINTVFYYKRRKRNE